MFHVRRRPADQAARRRKKKLSGSSGNTSTSTINRLPQGGQQEGHGVGGGGVGGLDGEMDRAMLPFLLELNPDGSEVRQTPHAGPVRRHFLPPTVTEVGSERPSAPHGHPSAPMPGKIVI